MDSVTDSFLFSHEIVRESRSPDDPGLLGFLGKSHYYRTGHTENYTDDPLTIDRLAQEPGGKNEDKYIAGLI